MERRTFLPLLGTAALGVSLLSATRKNWEGTHTPGLIFPKRLKLGDTIGITAPAGAVSDERDIEEFVEVLTELGFETKVGSVTKGRFGYFSGTDEERAADFMDMVTDDGVDAIFFQRGGWGCARILPLIDFSIIAENPKIIMGFSDITTLLNAITFRTGIVTFHGPSGSSSWNDYSVEYVKKLLLENDTLHYENHDENDLDIVTLTPGQAEGELYGGNLSVISGMVGSEYLPIWKGKILFLEDVSEEPYRIDRMLVHLKLAGVYDHLEGLILGTFSNCESKYPDRSFPLVEVFEHHFKDTHFPVYYGAQIGHTGNKYTVPVGPRVRMDADKGTLDLLEPCVT